MKDRILITGASGMLGTDLCLNFLKKYDVCGADLAGPKIKERCPAQVKFYKLDITDRLGTIKLINDIKPAIVVHAAAYTDVDGCEKDKSAAFNVNADGAGNVALGCKKINATLFYISTDFVFDGKKTEPYTEDDDTNPINIYGESKLAGERLVVQNAGSHVIVRTSWLFGKCGKNFVDTIIGLAKTRKEIKVVDDQIGSPTYTADLAKAIFKLAEITMAKPVKDIYHISNNGKVSWYEYTRRILEYAHIADVKVTPITSEELDRPAKRHKMSALNNSRYQKTTHDKMRDYNEALQEYLIK